MAIDILRLIGILAICIFYIVSDKEWQKTRESKIVRLILWGALMLFTILDLIFSPTAVWILTLATLILNIYIVYRYAKEIWPKDEDCKKEESDNKSETLNKKE